jgi:putative Mg2+ transporter-C (MgtC) family protein
MLDWSEIILRLTAAAAMGGAIGLNRHLHHKATGLRTLSLLACSAAALVLGVLYGADGALHVEAMSRVIQGIMTGLGFIGVGVIMHDQGAEKVHGLTTAAAVWTTAALGVLCGTGAWKVVVVLAVLAWVVLLVGGPIERRCHAVLGRKPDDPGP